MNNIYAECADLDSSDCILYPEWCLWDNSSSVCENVSNDTLLLHSDSPVAPLKKVSGMIVSPLNS